MGNKLSKSLYHAVKKAIDSKTGAKHAVSHVISDIEDPDMIPEAAQHVPASGQEILHKDVSVSEIHAQKQANAEAQVGMAPKAPPMKGIQKLKKFMDNSAMKKNATKQFTHKDIKGVHTSGGFSGLEEKGQSQAGRSYERSKEPQPNKYLNQLYSGRAKTMHEEKLKELKEMPKPKLPK